MLSYEDMVVRWGVAKLSIYSGIRGKFDPASVAVDFGVNEGFACCGGSDPDCYCSFAEAPYLKADITYRTLKGGNGRITVTDLDFANTMREFIAAGQ